MDVMTHGREIRIRVPLLLSFSEKKEVWSGICCPRALIDHPRSSTAAGGHGDTEESHATNIYHSKLFWHDRAIISSIPYLALIAAESEGYSYQE
jgi:hypothetical protein